MVAAFKLAQGSTDTSPPSRAPAVTLDPERSPPPLTACNQGATPVQRVQSWPTAWQAGCCCWAAARLPGPAEGRMPGRGGLRPPGAPPGAPLSKYRKSPPIHPWAHSTALNVGGTAQIAGSQGRRLGTVRPCGQSNKGSTSTASVAG